MKQVINHKSKTYYYGEVREITRDLVINKEGFFTPESQLIRDGYKNVGFERQLLRSMGKLNEIS